MKKILCNLVVLGLTTFSFGVDTTVQTGEGHDFSYYRKLWVERTKGKILSNGKKVTFSIPNNYRLTNDAKDPFDLTDGKLSTNKKDLIWFGKDALGWFGGISDGGVNFQVDLGEVKNVDKLVIRCLGGEVQKTLGFPKRFEVYVSIDGKNYYQTAKLQKLAESDRELSDFVNNFYIPERGKAIVYPFELNVNAKARYVAFTIASAAGGLFADELAIMEGNPKKANFNTIYKKQPQPFYTQGVLIRPKVNEFILARNIVTPTFFSFCDMRLASQKKSPMLLDIDLPEGIKVLSPKALKEVKFTNKKGEKRVKFTLKAIPRPWTGGTTLKEIFFKVTKDMPKNSKAFFSSYSNGVAPINLEFPLKVVEIKPVPKLKRLHVSLAWMSSDEARVYPEFFKSWKTIGFNAVNCFPRYFTKTDKATKGFLDNARKNGMKIVMTDSPIHAMPGKGKKGHEMNCLNTNTVAVCPSYVGPFHKKEVERIKECVVKSQPDIIFFDIEAFYSSHVTALTCSRCKAAMKTAKMTSMDQFTKKVVAQKVNDFYNAVKAGAAEAKIKCPPIGLYGKGPGMIDRSQPVLDWKQLYPKSIAISQPSLYVGERPWLVQERIRSVYKLMKNHNIIPWLTAGTYGDIRAQFVEYIALEAILNGAGGITYFAYWDFDNASDYAALAKALYQIAPYEDLIMDGKLVDIPVNGVNTTAIVKGNEMLLLVGNYQKPNITVNVKLPFNKVTLIKDIRDNEKFKLTNTVTLKIPRSSIRLLYVKGK
jgi:hypothetical protein